MNYRGDTFIRNYSIETDTGDYTFENGDVLKTVFVTEDGKEIINKTINLVEGDTDVNVVWSAEDMSKLEEGNYTLETEVTTSNWTKTIQENVTILKDYIVGE